MSDISFSGVTGGISDILNIGQQVAGLFGRKKRQEEAWQREDTAVQRRVNDLEAAGLNKVLAAGSPAQSSQTQFMTGGSRVGGAADAALKEMSKKLVEEQTVNAGLTNDILNNQKTITSGNASVASDEAATSRDWRNALTGDPNHLSTMLDIQKGRLSNEKILLDQASNMNVPVEFLMSGPGQQVMLNQYIQSLSAADKAIFLKNMALMGIAGGAGQTVNRFIPTNRTGGK